MKKALVGLLLACALTSARVWYVHPDSSLRSIQQALDLCSTGDTVLVGPGRYPGGYDWPTVADIRLIGEQGPESTVVDGGGSQRGFALFNVPGEQTLIAGLTIQNCISSTSGGAVEAVGTSLSLERCHILNNASRQAGALSIDDGRVTVRACSIAGNSSSLYRPGGIWLGNDAAGSFDGCRLVGNRRGALAFLDGAGVVLRRCDIVGNTGAAVACFSSGASADAEYNWWGDADGPYHPVLNPYGRGDTVGDCVDFDPWLLGPAAVGAPPAGSFRSAPGASVVRGERLLLELSGTAELIDAAGRPVRLRAAGSGRPVGLRNGVYFVRGAADQRPRAGWRLVVLR